jgi:RHS repeat-associated protein
VPSPAANSYTYTTWGTPTTSTHNSIPDLGFRFLYVGAHDVQWDDAYSLGLHYMHARHYSPLIGRFLQPDPTAQEANLYAYAANSPVTEMDPDGTCFILCGVINAIADTAIYLATAGDLMRRRPDRREALIAGGAIRVRGDAGTRLLSIEAWNRAELWRGDYGDLAQGSDFVAETFLGEQYRIDSAGVFRWDPETGQQDLVADSFEEWLAKVSRDPGSEVPDWLLADWVAVHGPLPTTSHLLPAVPYVLGGDYDVANLTAIDAVASMRWRAQLARQIRDLPDGEPVKLRVDWSD